MILCLLLTLGVHAEPLTLDYADTLQRALNANPTLQGARLDVDAADGALLAAKGIYDPTLRGGTNLNAFTSESIREFGEVVSEFRSFSWDAGVNQVLPTGTTLDMSWATSQTRFKYELRNTGFIVEREDPLFESRMVTSISQSLLKGHQLAANLEGVRQANHARTIAQATKRSTQQQVLADVAGAYWGLRYQQRLVHIASRGLEAAEEEARVVHAQIDQGQLAQMEGSRVDAAKVQAQIEHINADHAALVAADTLLMLIGEAPGREVILSTQPADPVPIDLDLDALVTVAMENNPELAASEAGEVGADAALAAARHRRLPQLDLTGRYALVGYEPSTAAATSELFDGELPEWSVGTVFSMPLLGRASRGDVLSKQAEATRARRTRQELKRSITQQIRAQARTLEASHTQVSLARANQRYAEDTLAAQRALQAAGQAIQKDVLESMAGAQDAAAALEKALADHQQALIELERLKGTL